MTLSEELTYVSDLAVLNFAGVNTITAIIPLELVTVQNAGAASSDIIPPAAGHIFYLKNLSLYETQAITGTPYVAAYDIAAAAQTLHTLNLNAGEPGLFGRLFCSRLRHELNGASAGFYSIVFDGFDLTYT